MRFPGYVMLLLLAFVAPTVSFAYGDVFYYPYWGPHHGYYYEYPYYNNRDTQRLRREIRRQRQFDNERQRQTEREMNELRRQAFSNQQVSARQACFYRTTGGFEVCADLFAELPEKLTHCEALVIARNPSCNDVPLKTQRPVE